MGSDYLTSMGFSFRVRIMFWNWIKVTVYNSVNVLKTTELSPLKGQISWINIIIKKIFLKRQGRRICRAAVLENSRSGQHTRASHQGAVYGFLCGPT